MRSSTSTRRRSRRTGHIGDMGAMIETTRDQLAYADMKLCWKLDHFVKMSNLVLYGSGYKVLRVSVSLHLEL